MMLRLSVFGLFLALPALAPAAEYHLYFLGGQSNMDGYGQVAELPEEVRGVVDGVMIFHGNPAPDGIPVDGRGLWAPLQPGHGVGFSTDGRENQRSNRFGVELSFARRLREQHPDRRIALIKYSRGGTSIAAAAARHFGCWTPDFTGGEGAGNGINQYDHFLATMHHALRVSDIDGDGEADKLIPAGILWMQGESDAALDQQTAEAYGANLKDLIDRIRAAMHRDDAPVAIGLISDSGKDEQDGKVWDFGAEVQQQQEEYVLRDGRAALVTSTKDYAYSDPWHYDSAGYLDLGRGFADAILAVPDAP